MLLSGYNSSIEELKIKGPIRTTVSTTWRADAHHIAGRYSALLDQSELGPDTDGNILAGSAWIQQRIRVPNTPQPHLTFHYRVISYDASVGSDSRLWDTFDVFIGEALVSWAISVGPWRATVGARRLSAAM